MDALIVGSGRCGTMLLSYCLGIHSACFVMGESYWHIPILRRIGDRTASPDEYFALIHTTKFVNGIPTLAQNLNLYGIQLSNFQNEYTSRFGHGLVAAKIFFENIEAILLDLTKKNRFIDKTPHYGLHIGELVGVWPRLRIIHLIRNGRDAAASMRDHPGFQATARHGLDDWTELATAVNPAGDDNAPLPPLEWFFESWARHVDTIRRACEKLPSGQVLELRYEDMMADYSAKLREVCVFLGIAADEDWITAVMANVIPQPKRKNVPDLQKASSFARDIYDSCGYQAEAS